MDPEPPDHVLSIRYIIAAYSPKAYDEVPHKNGARRCDCLTLNVWENPSSWGPLQNSSLVQDGHRISNGDSASTLFGSVILGSGKSMLQP